MLRLLVLSSLVLSAQSIGILLPLYVYPGTNAGNWLPVIKAAAAYPEVQWEVIINPQNGPGTNTTNPFPNDDYIAGISALNAVSNIQLLGYVDTAWANRPLKDIHSDIDKYAAWEKYNGKNSLNLDGIFFDDVPSFYDFIDRPNSVTPNETFFQNITSYATASIHAGLASTVCNSGNPSDAMLFQYCNTMIEYESTYQGFSSTTLASLTKNGAKLNQTAIVMYSAPRNVTQSTLNDTVRSLKSNNVQSVGLTNDCCYNSLNETLLKMVAAACDVSGGTVVNSSADVSAPAMSTFWLSLSASTIFLYWS